MLMTPGCTNCCCPTQICAFAQSCTHPSAHYGYEPGTFTFSCPDYTYTIHADAGYLEVCTPPGCPVSADWTIAFTPDDTTLYAAVTVAFGGGGFPCVAVGAPALVLELQPPYICCIGTGPIDYAGFPVPCPVPDVINANSGRFGSFQVWPWSIVPGYDRCDCPAGCPVEDGTGATCDSAVGCGFKGTFYYPYINGCPQTPDFGLGSTLASGTYPVTAWFTAGPCSWAGNVIAILGLFVAIDGSPAQWHYASYEGESSACNPLTIVSTDPGLEDGTEPSFWCFTPDTITWTAGTPAPATRQITVYAVTNPPLTGFSATLTQDSVATTLSDGGTGQVVFPGLTTDPWTLAVTKSGYAIPVIASDPVSWPTTPAQSNTFAGAVAFLDPCNLPIDHVTVTLPSTGAAALYFGTYAGATITVPFVALTSGLWEYDAGCLVSGATCNGLTAAGYSHLYVTLQCNDDGSIGIEVDWINYPISCTDSSQFGYLTWTGASVSQSDLNAGATMTTTDIHCVGSVIDSVSIVVQGNT